ncbi:hypothetical protein C2E23DRAFT_886910 [Lenzites betulinus]|nr:hypothetical protein C2E23DRAFT_886910 [Lenzites betulinus]
MSSSAGIPSLGRTYGALYVGSCLGFMLYGLTVHQVYKYYKLYPSDIAFLKYLVLLIFVLETFHTLLWVIDGYHYFIQDYFDPDALSIGHWTDKINIFLTGLVIVICQGFYARRVFLIGPKFKGLVAIAAMCMGLFFGFDIAAGVIAFTTLNLVTFARYSWMISAAYGFALVTDIILTGTLVVVLLRCRTGLQQTDSVVELLVIYAINTGLLTSIFGVLAFVFALILPGNLIYAGISIVVAKLYANSVLAVLNSRRALQHRLLDDLPISISMHKAAPRHHQGIMESWSVPQLPTSTTLKFATLHTTEPGTQSNADLRKSEERSSEGDVQAAEDA